MIIDHQQLMSYDLFFNEDYWVLHLWVVKVVSNKAKKCSFHSGYPRKRVTKLRSTHSNEFSLELKCTYLWLSTNIQFSNDQMHVQISLIDEVWKMSSPLKWFRISDWVRVYLLFRIIARFFPEFLLGNNHKTLQKSQK